MQYDGSQDTKVVRRFYAGTSTLRTGQVLGYDQTATKTNADPKQRLGAQVLDLAAGTVSTVAGFVHESAAGRVGPCFVELYEPIGGDVILSEVDGAVAVAANDNLIPDSTKAALIKGTALVGTQAFRALEAQAVNGKVAILVYKV